MNKTVLYINPATLDVEVPVTISEAIYLKNEYNSITDLKTVLDKGLAETTTADLYNPSTLFAIP